MLDTKIVRSKIDCLSAADGADTYWRETMIEALDAVDKLRTDSEMHRKANESLSAALRNVTMQMRNVEEKEAACCPEDVGFDEYIRTLTADLENRKQQFDAYCDAEEINNAGLEQEIATLQSALDAADKRNDDQKRLSDDARYEVGIMSAITGRQDNETLTEAVTRVCHQLAAFYAACHHVADLYGEDSERGLAAAEILRYQRNFRAETEDTDTKIRRKVLGIAQGAADDLRKRGRSVPDHTQAIIEDLEAILDE